MSPLSAFQAKQSQEFLPPPYEEPHVRRQIDDLLAEVAETIPPVWPLQDYVAVNPYAGLTQRTFMEARATLKLFSDCETLMPLRYYARQYMDGGFGDGDIVAALEELFPEAGDRAGELTPAAVAERLKQVADESNLRDQDDVDQVAAAKNGARKIKTIAEQADSLTDLNWSEAIVDEVSKYCAAHFDEGQAGWRSPWSDLPLYQAWRNWAMIDRNLETLGLSGLRRLVGELPHQPDAAIVYLLQRMGVPEHLWRLVLLCQAFSVPGWSSWAKYQDAWNDDDASGCENFAALLAIRLTYDVALGESMALFIDWNSISTKESATFETAVDAHTEDADLRWVLLRASEIAFQDRLLGSLCKQQSFESTTTQQASSADAISKTRKLAQMVFCIDVRSERIRRSLESNSDGIETFGFAGFFGMPIEFVKLGGQSRNAHVPVLLKPQFQLHEGLHEPDSPSEQQVIEKRGLIRSWRKLWKSFQTSAVSCFGFVETTGLLFGWKLLAGTVAIPDKIRRADLDGVDADDEGKLGPTLRGLNHQEITTSHQADLAESMLRNLGLIEDFARLVVLCGHASQTENNPLAASLDCGACGGHSGEPNARMAAALLNQGYIRSALADRGIVIPEDTHFLGGLHNTTTDQIKFFDLDEVPASHQTDLEDLMRVAEVAGRHTRSERLPMLAGNEQHDLLRRADDWSEVRPEWGLAGNAAFVVGPRWMTKSADLEGRSFLHSYDSANDPDGSILETIMTAPMIVAHWINMQYYASAVDHHHFGSGNKTVHNVVGQFGILSGNSGDLMTGLPWQSLHTGDHFQHQPQRLQVVIAAPRTSIENVVSKHALVADLLTNGWLHLIAVDGGEFYRFTTAGEWQMLQPQQSAEANRELQSNPIC